MKINFVNLFFGKFYFCTDLITHMHQFNAYYGECTKFGRKKGNQSYNQIIRFCYFRNLATSQGLMQSKAACRTCTAIQGAWHPACERQSRMRDLFSRCPMAERLPLFSYFRNSPEEQYKSQKSCALIIKLHCCTDVICVLPVQAVPGIRAQSSSFSLRKAAFILIYGRIQ